MVLAERPDAPTSASTRILRYRYEDLSPGQFEDFVIALCGTLLGAGVQGFATGADAGRDARFAGTANLLPSERKPWSGTIIVQAKHTNGVNRSCSEPDFFSESSDETVIGEELPRIKKLREAGELDHYLVFTNRRLSSIADEKIRNAIARECDVPKGSIQISGLELLDQWAKAYPQAAESAKLDPVDSPLIFSPDDIALIVEAIDDNTAAISTALDEPPERRIPYDEKNAINNMSPEYALNLRRNYLKDTEQIRRFLSAPENDDLRKRYEASVEELQQKIIAHRRSYQSFDRVFEYLLTLLFDRDAVLRSRKRLTRTLLFYMYWNCDIGSEQDAPT